VPWHMLDKFFFHIYIEVCTRVLFALASPQHIIYRKVNQTITELIIKLSNKHKKRGR